MVRAIASRLGLALVTLLVISVITFAGTNQSAREVAMNAVGHELTPAQLGAYARSHGLDRPIVVRYVKWLGGFATGNWGVSELSGLPVRPQVLPRFERTLILTLAAMIIGLPLGVIVGMGMALRRGTNLDRGVLVGLVALAAMPEFVVGVALLTVFAVVLGWLPVESGALSFGGSLGGQIRAYVLPTLTLAAGIVPPIARVARTSTIDAASAPYTRAAELRGLLRVTVIWRHILRNASLPLINVIAINLVYLLGGVIVVENVFAFPGIGQALVTSVTEGDTTTTQAIAMLLGVMVIVITTCADWLILYLNPKLKSR